MGGPNANWVRKGYRADMTDDEARCVETLCALAAPYNIPFPAGNDGWRKNATWLNGRGLAVVLRATLSTYDFNDLTRLVVAAHRNLVRVQIAGKSNGCMEIMFHARKAEGNLYERHPDADALHAMFLPLEATA